MTHSILCYHIQIHANIVDNRYEWIGQERNMDVELEKKIISSQKTKIWCFLTFYVSFFMRLISQWVFIAVQKKNCGEYFSFAVNLT